MRCERLLALGTLLAASPLPAQQNPFALTSPSVKSAYIVYDMTNKGSKLPGATMELGVTGKSWVMRMAAPIDLGGKRDTVRGVAVETTDSVYRYHTVGTGAPDAQVSASVRGHLVRAYDGLDAAGKARLRENLRLAAQGSSDDDFDQLIAFTGRKTGSATVAGQRCDVYAQGSVTACVLPLAPSVPLRWSDRNGNEMVATKVTLNGPMPPEEGEEEEPSE